MLQLAKPGSAVAQCCTVLHQVQNVLFNVRFTPWIQSFEDGRMTFKGMTRNMRAPHHYFAPRPWT